MVNDARGVLADRVVRDPCAESALIFVDLAEGIDAGAGRAWLSNVGGLVERLRSATEDGDRLASVAFGLGARFFARAAEWGALTPRGLLEPPALPIPAEAHDAVFYIMVISEAVLAEFLAGLAATKPALASVSIERGFQRRDRRETFGQPDGLRNVRSPDRRRIAFVDTNDSPDEPSWCDGGSYLAYLKIRQNLQAWSALDTQAQQAVTGRRSEDGSRLDLPMGTDPWTEGSFTGENLPPVTSHIRKAGPRGEVHDQMAIFRRGTPYLTLAADGAVDAGLQFVSFQAHLEAFDVVLNRWMLNPHFPTPNAGQDALIARRLVTFLRAGLFFVPPNDDRFPAAGLFDALTAPRGKPTQGRWRLRKRVVDASGTPVPAERAGMVFQLFTPGGQPFGEPFITDSAGRATSPLVPLDTPLILREITPPPNLTPAPEQTVILTQANDILHVINTVTTPGSGYGG